MVITHYTTYSCGQCGNTGSSWCDHFREIEIIIAEHCEERLRKSLQEGVKQIKWPVEGTENRGSSVRQCESSLIPLSDERLAELETVIQEYGIKGYDKDDFLSLMAEIRRLKRENHLLNLSRGVPSIGSQD